MDRKRVARRTAVVEIKGKQKALRGWPAVLVNMGDQHPARGITHRDLPGVDVAGAVRSLKRRGIRVRTQLERSKFGGLFARYFIEGVRLIEEKR